MAAVLFLAGPIGGGPGDTIATSPRSFPFVWRSGNLLRLSTPMAVFTFKPRWKEELICTGPGGSFILELSMGILSAYLPTETGWSAKSPPWARELWPVLKLELEEWCSRNGARFFIDESAAVWWDA